MIDAPLQVIWTFGPILTMRVWALIVAMVAIMTPRIDRRTNILFIFGNLPFHIGISRREISGAVILLWPNLPSNGLMCILFQNEKPQHESFELANN